MSDGIVPATSQSSIVPSKRWGAKKPSVSVPLKISTT